MTKIKDSGKREEFDSGAVRDTRTGKGRFDLISPFAMYRLAHIYEGGALKYEDRNWERGMPFSRTLDSALRHLNRYQMGLNDEDHLAMAFWNIAALLHFEAVKPHLNDLPDYTIKSPSNNAGGADNALASYKPTEKEYR